MGGLVGWLKKASVKLLDPGRQERVRQAATEIERQLAVQLKAFSLEAVTQTLDVFREDIPLAIDEAYRSLLRRAWRDAEISDAERRTLEWAASALKISRQRQRELEQVAATECFRNSLAGAISDGKLTQEEIGTLHRISKELSLSIPQMVRGCLTDEGDEILRTMFAGVSSTGRILEEEWESLLQAVQTLGLTEQELLVAIQSEAEHLVEQTLAEAKADGQVTPSEEHGLRWLTSRIIARTDFRAYVLQELGELKLLQDIGLGRLPSIRSVQVSLRAGEVVHAEGSAQFHRTRSMRSGPRTDAFEGLLTLTDNRLLFACPLLGVAVDHRRVLDLVPYRNGFQLTSSSKGTGFYVPQVRPDLFNRMYLKAIGMANQTMIRRTESEAGSRHIPRDVRQRVWQRCGGRCAECQATDYLEFDHIIPVAKGGNNGDNNVQLLCRRCNSRKSDMI